MKIALCQFNPTIGAIDQNADRMLDYAEKAASQGAELLFFPELSLCGYPPKDMVFEEDFQKACSQALKELAQKSPLGLIVGAPTLERYNAAFLCDQAAVRLLAVKKLLPNYQVFDEQRYFMAGKAKAQCFVWRSQSFGVSICEDAWADETGFYVEDPVQDLLQQGAQILVNLQASPFEIDKPARREAMFCRLAKKYGKMLMVVGQVGANDGLIFDGGSLIIDASGKVVWRAPSFEEALQCFYLP